eukprot:UN28403
MVVRLCAYFPSPLKTSVTECSSIQIGMIPSILPELGTCFRMRIFDRDRSFSLAIN